MAIVGTITMRPRTSLLSAIAALLISCGGSSAVPARVDAGANAADSGPAADAAVSVPDSGGSADAGATLVDAGRDSQVPADSGGDAGGSNDGGLACGESFTCHPTTEYCLVSEVVIGPGGGNIGYSCQPMPAGCTEATACSCLVDAGLPPIQSCTDDGGVTVITQTG